MILTPPIAILFARRLNIAMGVLKKSVLAAFAFALLAGCAGPHARPEAVTARVESVRQDRITLQTPDDYLFVNFDPADRPRLKKGDKVTVLLRNGEYAAVRLADGSHIRLN